MSRIFSSMYDQYRKWGLSDRVIVCLTGMEEGFFSGIWTYLINPRFNSMLRLNPWTGMILDLLGNVIPFLLLHHQRLIFRGGHIWRVPPDDAKGEKLRDYAWLMGMRVSLNLIFLLMLHLLPRSIGGFLGLPVLWILHSAINFLGQPMGMASGTTVAGCKYYPSVSIVVALSCIIAGRKRLPANRQPVSLHGL